MQREETIRVHIRCIPGIFSRMCFSSFYVINTLLTHTVLNSRHSRHVVIFVFFQSLQKDFIFHLKRSQTGM